MICSRRRSKTTTNPTIKKVETIAKLAAELAGLELPDEAVLSVVIAGPCVMRQVNRDFLGHDYLTDVICFDYRDDPTFSPDDVAVEILISPDMAEIQAAENSKKRTPGSELLLYLAHGILHAAGERDSTPEQKRRMRREERSLLKALADRGVDSLLGIDSATKEQN